jgi:hypothetical protein
MWPFDGRAIVCLATVILCRSLAGTIGASVTVEETGDVTARLTFNVGETGVLVTGEQSAVSAYTAQLRNLASKWGQPVTVSEVADIGAAAATVTSFAASSGSYVQLSQRSMELLRQHQMIPGQTAEFFQGAAVGHRAGSQAPSNSSPFRWRPVRPQRCS